MIEPEQSVIPVFFLFGQVISGQQNPGKIAIGKDRRATSVLNLQFTAGEVRGNGPIRDILQHGKEVSPDSHIRNQRFLGR